MPANNSASVTIFSPTKAVPLISQMPRLIGLISSNLKMIVSPGTTVLSFDGTWTSILDYQASELSAAIDAIKAIRHLMASHLKRIVDADWSRYGYMFADGKGFTLEEALQHFIGHVGFHRELIDRNIKLFS